jgi:predicted nucleic acid-binding protein
LIDRSPVEQVVVQLARRHRLTVYETGYLELAPREGVKLATLDKPLAAEREGVTLIG